MKIINILRKIIKVYMESIQPHLKNVGEAMVKCYKVQLLMALWTIKSFWKGTYKHIVGGIKIFMAFVPAHSALGLCARH
jgi:hypothetical protein